MWVLRPVFHLDRLLVQVEAQGFLLFHITTGDADEEGIITIGNGVNIAPGKGRSFALIEAKLLLHGQFGMPCGVAAIIKAFPARHVSVMLVLAIHHPAGAVVVRSGLAAFFPAMDQLIIRMVISVWIRISIRSWVPIGVGSRSVVSIGIGLDITSIERA